MELLRWLRWRGMAGALRDTAAVPEMAWRKDGERAKISHTEGLSFARRRLKPTSTGPSSRFASISG